MITKNLLSVVLLGVGIALVVTLGIGTPGYAEEVLRSNWIPNRGQLQSGEQGLGDMWTFRCPEGGTFNARAQNKDDLDTGEACTDLLMEVYDNDGNLIAFADDNLICTYPQVCGFACPEVTNVNCVGDDGFRDRHSIVVRDFGTASATGVSCNKGGGYELTVEGFDDNGDQVSERKLRLGGGPFKFVPRWAVQDGKAPVGPALDDENVPGSYLTK